jgi:uncharacterized protein YndB with AHSA1/START domain
MELKFKVDARVAKPVAEVFEAVVDPAQLSRYFTTGGAEGRIEAGATVYWDFHDFPGGFPVEVMAVEPNHRIVLSWEVNEEPSRHEGSMAKAPPPYSTTVTMEFDEFEPGRTLVSIAEEGWHETQAGLKASYGNCQGWSQMLCALKVWLEHGINLRDGMYK